MSHDWLPPTVGFRRRGWVPKLTPLPPIVVVRTWLASLVGPACLALRQARIARLSGVLGLLLVVSAGLSACERYSPLERRTLIAHHNLTVSYPIVATIIPFEDHTIAYFLNLTDGRTHRLFEEKTRYIDVQKIPGEHGRFILIRNDNEGRSFVEYDFQTNTSRILQDAGGVTSLFVIGNKNCGLDPTRIIPAHWPTSITTEWYADFKTFCNGTLVAPHNIIKDFDLLVQGDEEVTIIESEGDKSVRLHNIKDSSGEIHISTMKIHDLPYYSMPRRPFYYHGNLYILKGRSPPILFQVNGGKVTEYSGELLTRLTRAKLGRRDHIISVENTLFVTASRSPRDGQINVSTWNDSGGKIAEWTIDVSSLN